MPRSSVISNVGPLEEHLPSCESLLCTSPPLAWWLPSCLVAQQQPGHASITSRCMGSLRLSVPKH